MNEQSIERPRGMCTPVNHFCKFWQIFIVLLYHVYKLEKILHSNAVLRRVLTDFMSSFRLLVILENSFRSSAQRPLGPHLHLEF